MLTANYSVAQQSEQLEAVGLHTYYSDLYLALAHYEIDDVPFKQKKIKVLPNDSLLDVATRYPIDNLDSTHLAAAIYEANAELFDRGNVAQLNSGATINMPSVGDIFYAQTRYEGLRSVEGAMDLGDDGNQMRIGLRQPFVDSHSMIGQLAGNGLLRSEEFSLPGYRHEATNGDREQAANGFIAQSARPTLSVVAKPVAKAGEGRAPSVSDAIPAASQEAAVANELAIVETSSTLNAPSVVAPGVSKEQMTNDTKSAAMLVANRKTNNRDSDNTAALAVAQVEPAIGAVLPVVGTSGDGAYLGVPRHSGAASSLDMKSDPLSTVIEWSFEGGASLGMVLTRLAEYVGYELVSNDEIVLDAYNRQLPVLQRNVNGITAEDAFYILGGRGLETDFDHVARSVRHLARTNVSSTQVSDSLEVSTSHEEIVQASGIAPMLQQLPEDILSASKRHANRCDSSVSTTQPDVERLFKTINVKLQKTTPEPIARKLITWYESPTGRKVLKLEKQELDDAKLQEYLMDGGRLDRISAIYDNTVTGRGIAGIAVALDHAGWLLSGCKQEAESSGDVAGLNQEMVRGRDIKKKRGKLESLLREDMLRSLAYQFSSLSERQLTEYADITTEYSGVFSALEQSIIDAIEQESEAGAVSAID